MSILDQFRLDRQVALVTGVGRGIGQAIALGLAEAGADIIGLYRTHYEETQAHVVALGRRFVPAQCNLRTVSVAETRTLVADLIRETGRLDILVNNAGIIRRSSALEFSETDWDDVMAVNLKSVFFLSQAVARAMVAQGKGKIINVASLLSFQGGILVPSYTAAKSGVAGLTRALANEWAPRHINVNALVPGYIETDNTAPLRSDPARNEAILSRIPAGHWGQKTQLQGAAVFLASTASDYVHGALLPVDGGWLAR